MKNQPTTGVLLVNQGTPDSPSVPDVRKYLREFLMDERVIDLPFLKRWPLVNLLIAPTRAPKSAKVYQELWTPQGSPLKVIGHEVTRQLQATLGDAYVVKLAMRYQNPSIQEALAEFQHQQLSRLVIVPLYPQYASATTGSVYQKVMETVQGWQVLPEIRFVNSFVEHPQFIEAFAELGKKYLQSEAYDHVLFSYHGLPERQLHKGENTSCTQEDCTHGIHAHNQFCYRAQCYETSRQIAGQLGLTADQYTVAFQSRLGKDPWIQPYTDDVIGQLTAKGVKRVLAFAPSFIADCLETTVEVGREYKELFEALGGEHWQLVESLNTSPTWIACLQDLVLNTSAAPVPALKAA